MANNLTSSTKLEEARVVEILYCFHERRLEIFKFCYPTFYVHLGKSLSIAYNAKPKPFIRVIPNETDAIVAYMDYMCCAEDQIVFVCQCAGV